MDDDGWENVKQTLAAATGDFSLDNGMLSSSELLITARRFWCADEEKNSCECVLWFSSDSLDGWVVRLLLLPRATRDVPEIFFRPGQENTKFSVEVPGLCPPVWWFRDARWFVEEGTHTIT